MPTPSVQQPLKAFPVTGGPIKTVAFFPDGKRIITGGHLDCLTHIWNLETGEEDGEPLAGHTLPTLSVAVSKRGSDVVTGGGDQKVFLWDLTKKTKKVLFAGPKGGEVCTVAFNSTLVPTHVASSGSDGIVNIYKVEQDAYSNPNNRIVIPNTQVTSIQFSPQTEAGHPVLIAVASSDKKARVFDAYSGQKKAEFVARSSKYMPSLLWFPGGQLLGFGDDNSIRIWDWRTLADHAIGEPFFGHTRLVESISISPQGRFVASASSDNTLRLWNAVTRAQIGNPIIHPAPVTIVSFSPDGKSVLSVTRDEITLWDMDYLEVEEGLQDMRRVLGGLVSSSAENHGDLRKMIQTEFKNIRQGHDQKIEEQSQLFKDEISVLLGDLNDMKDTQDSQFSSVVERLDSLTSQQESNVKELQITMESNVQKLENELAIVVLKNNNELQGLRDENKALARQLTTVQKDFNAVQKSIDDLLGFLKKAFPATTVNTTPRS